MMVQAAGRIDRRNTPYKDLYYYHLKSSSKIDNVIARTLKRKKTFSEKGFAPIFKKEDINNKPEPRQLSLFDENLNPIDYEKDSNKSSSNWVDDHCDIYCNWEDPNSPMYDQEWVKNNKKISNVKFKKE